MRFGITPNSFEIWFQQITFPSYQRRKVYHNRNEARADVFDYNESFYNLLRRYSKIGDLSPIEYEVRTISP